MKYIITCMTKVLVQCWWKWWPGDFTKFKRTHMQSLLIPKLSIVFCEVQVSVHPKRSSLMFKAIFLLWFTFPYKNWESISMQLCVFRIAIVLTAHEFSREKSKEQWDGGQKICTQIWLGSQTRHTHDRQTVRSSSFFLGCLKKVDLAKFGPTEGCCFFCNSLHSCKFLNIMKILKSCKLIELAKLLISQSLVL